MTHPNQTPYQEADACLALMRAEVDAGLQHLNRACSSEGRLSAEQLDAHQEVSYEICLLYTSPSPRDRTRSRMPSSA